MSSAAFGSTPRSLVSSATASPFRSRPGPSICCSCSPNTHRLLPKNELMETLWPDSFVEEANLTQYVYTLRKALGS
jgi:hypothetical protein